MEIKDRHLLLVDGFFADGVMTRLTDVMYFKSKFERELGDKLKVDGETFYVGAIAESKEEILALREQLVKAENKKRRKESKKLDRELFGPGLELFLKTIGKSL